MLVVLIAGFGALGLSLLHFKYFAFSLLIIVYVAVPDLERFRRAVILTANTVKYRPPVGEVWEFPVWYIKRLERTTTTPRLSWNGVPRVRAVELTFVDGQRLLISLDVPRGEELLERLCSMTNLKCS